MEDEGAPAPADGQTGWRMKGKNWFSSKAPSVREGFKKITDKAPTVKEGLKKITTKVEGIRMNAPMKEGLKRITTTTGPVKEGFNRITATEGLMKGKETLEKGLISVSAFTQDETKLIVSRAKRKFYCKSEEIEDPEFAVSLDSAQSWKLVLEAQRNSIRRMIRNQKVFEDSQIQLTSALQKVPANCDYSSKSVLLGGVMESRVQALVPTSGLEELADKIEEILSNEFTDLQAMKRKYTTAKNEVDVCSARLENKGDSERLRCEVVQATQRYMQCRADITELTTKINKMESTIFDPILSQFSGEEPSVQTNVKSDIR